MKTIKRNWIFDLLCIYFNCRFPILRVANFELQGLNVVIMCKRKLPIVLQNNIPIILVNPYYCISYFIATLFYFTSQNCMFVKKRNENFDFTCKIFGL